MRALIIPVLLSLGACAATQPSATLSANANETFSASSAPPRLTIESKAIGIYLAPCASNVCGTVVITPGSTFRFAHPVVSVTDLQHKPRPSLLLDASDSEIDLSADNSESSGWSLQGKRPRPGKRQNFVVHVDEPAGNGLVLQLPDVELNGKPVQLPAITMLHAQKVALTPP